MWSQADVAKARDELSRKSLETIQEETAYAWGARAMAAFEISMGQAASTFLSDALEYRHEALEHAALAGPKVYLQVPRPRQGRVRGPGPHRTGGTIGDLALAVLEEFL